MTQRSQVAQVAAQIGSRLEPDNAAWTNRFTVRSHTSNAVYVVAQRRTDNVWGCSCKGWTHYRRCKHLADILDRLASLPAAGFTPELVSLLESARTAFLDLEVKPRAITVIRQNRVLDL